MSGLHGFDMHRRHRLKDEDTAVLLGLHIPGAGQLYSQDWALGLYLLGVALAAPFFWGSGQTAVAAIAFLVSWIAGLVLVPHSVRKFNDRENRRPPNLYDLVQ